MRIFVMKMATNGTQSYVFYQTNGIFFLLEKLLLAQYLIDVAFNFHALNNINLANTLYTIQTQGPANQ